MSDKTAPLLARVQADLIAMDRDELIDLSEWDSLREFVEVTRHSAAWIMVHRNGEPWEREDLYRLEVFLDDDHVVLERLPEPHHLLDGPMWIVDGSATIVAGGRDVEAYSEQILSPESASKVGLALIAAARSVDGRI